MTRPALAKPARVSDRPTSSHFSIDSLRTCVFKKFNYRRVKHYWLCGITLRYDLSLFSTDKRKLIHKCICHPIIEYGLPIFLSSVKLALCKIRTAGKSAHRRSTCMHNAAKSLFNPPQLSSTRKNGIIPISNRLKILTQRFLSENPDAIEPLCIHRPPHISNTYKCSTKFTTKSKLKNCLNAAYIQINKLRKYPSWRIKARNQVLLPSLYVTTETFVTHLKDR